MLLQFIANGLVTGAVYAIVALGFGLIYNTTKILHIAHGAVYVFSCYIFFTFYRILQLPLYFALPFGVILGSLFGIIMEIVVYHPLFERNASSGVMIVSSVGIYIFTVNVIALLFGNETKIVLPGIEKTYEFGGVILTRIQIYQVFAFLIVFVLFLGLLKKTNLGKAVRALADNPTLLSTFGVEISNLRIWIFALGSIFAGIASCLVAMDVGMDPNIGMPALLISAVSLIAGGIGIFEAAAIGGFTIGLIQTLAVWQISARWQEGITFLILILFLLLRPQGLLGKRRRVEEV
ncbi:MAG TPA: branched-chain amino acid ABC transporter permease [bacterium (Candidatus Stahlbacteria)]|nr:branched-chain amino acid ABC transporter permease [Candidatus Stahlbacteria bacterium]